MALPEGAAAPRRRACVCIILQDERHQDADGTSFITSCKILGVTVFGQSSGEIRSQLSRIRRDEGAILLGQRVSVVQSFGPT